MMVKVQRIPKQCDQFLNTLQGVPFLIGTIVEGAQVTRDGTPEVDEHETTASVHDDIPLPKVMVVNVLMKSL